MVRTRGCAACGDFSFNRLTLCFWCRRMDKHRTIKTYNTSFSYIVKLRRRYGFPAWLSFAECEKGLQQRAPEHGTWGQFLEGKSKGSTAKLRTHYYIVTETIGAMRWWDAHTVPGWKEGMFPDPDIPKPQPAKKKKKLLKKKTLRRKSG